MIFARPPPSLKTSSERADPGLYLPGFDSWARNGESGKLHASQRNCRSGLRTRHQVRIGPTTTASAPMGRSGTSGETMIQSLRKSGPSRGQEEAGALVWFFGVGPGYTSRSTRCTCWGRPSNDEIRDRSICSAGSRDRGRADDRAVAPMHRARVARQTCQERRMY